ncbi:MAG: bifunctional riboflavin kinase/FAD synthetase [Bacillota bacterium]|jgi:riboflavin kinase/FMN adenylyltransferase
MKVITQVEEFPQDANHVAVALGNFDGVHIGHQTILKKLVEKAQSEKGISVVFTFNPHPLNILKKDNCPMLLTELEDKKNLIIKLEVDYLLLFPFSINIAQMPPKDFVENILIKNLHAKSVFVGYNFTFGKRAEGNAELLKQICREHKCDVTVVPEVKFQNYSVSSTTIRKLLAEGKIRQANTLLGYAYNVSGIVVPGDQRGRKIGFPTANLNTSSNVMIPKNGVYAVRVLTENGFYHGIANIGIRPTIGNNLSRTIEVHLFQEFINLYDKKLRVFFIEHLREEKKFNDLQELSQQIKLDIEKAKIILQLSDNMDQY